MSLGSATISATVGSVTGKAPLSVIVNGWGATGSMQTARFGHTATLLPNGAVLVAGGIDAGGELASAEIYDSAAGTWTLTGTMTTQRAQHSATLMTNGTVLVAGGVVSASGQGLVSTEIYDPVAGTWSATGSRVTARYGHFATLLRNGSVQAAGGKGAVLQNSQAGGETYDPVAGIWTPTIGNMTNPHFDGTATMVTANGTVMVAGGYNSFGSGFSQATAEIYDPVAGTWSVTASMTTGSADDSATLLPNGTVLASGGIVKTSCQGRQRWLRQGPKSTIASATTRRRILIHADGLRPDTQQ